MDGDTVMLYTSKLHLVLHQLPVVGVVVTINRISILSSSMGVVVQALGVVCGVGRGIGVWTSLQESCIQITSLVVITCTIGWAHLSLDPRLLSGRDAGMVAHHHCSPLKSQSPPKS